MARHYQGVLQQLEEYRVCNIPFFTTYYYIYIHIMLCVIYLRSLRLCLGPIQQISLQFGRQPGAAHVQLASVLQLYVDLMCLEQFAVMNVCGFGKISKKHDKWTG